jgi:hypothetical protein
LEPDSAGHEPQHAGASAFAGSHAVPQQLLPSAPAVSLQQLPALAAGTLTFAVSIESAAESVWMLQPASRSTERNDTRRRFMGGILPAATRTASGLVHRTAAARASGRALAAVAR